MKKVFLFLIVCTSIYSCQKELILPNKQNKNFNDSVLLDETNGKSGVVSISFKNTFVNSVDSIYIFKNDVFVKKIAVGCGNFFFAELNQKYSFFKLKNNIVHNRLVNLYGVSINPITYFTFLNSNPSPTPIFLVDYLQQGVFIGAVITNPSGQCPVAQYTFNV